MKLICMECVKQGKPSEFEENLNGSGPIGLRPQCPNCLEEIDIENADDLDQEDLDPKKDDLDFMAEAEAEDEEEIE